MIFCAENNIFSDAFIAKTIRLHNTVVLHRSPPKDLNQENWSSTHFTWRDRREGPSSIPRLGPSYTIAEFNRRVNLRFCIDHRIAMTKKWCVKESERILAGVFKKMRCDLFCLNLGSKMRWPIPARGGHWGILETANRRKKSSKTAKPQKNSAKTENRIQNRYNGDKWGIQSKLN